ncbi:tripartite tricarboxylate transporter substrate binding protein [Allopusillimonas soli]|uniref:Tripartite tricarboxylate transporter substrate binding protein n=1 Tax=Allopusillimonas soli TaxID=659016 RepID=A0A853FGY1_9BURK|nr:tripartite tricarboxylate transporter substrate binding protein [Allopusillimonas soli]NYT37246.1 tripartite tricarboxylate transporter substrate binding protein [Allopusillimonas soli]TEA74754.1 tripartite tricarboxylate transporter substrate binding protein [Allopusillimonas soli]
MTFIRKLACTGILAASCAALVVPGAAAAASYPDKAVKLIVPFGAGGITDLIARHVSEKLAGALGQSVVVDNRAGAGGAIGAQAAATAAPDGYTIFMGTVGTQVVNPMIMKSINYDPADFVPIGMVSGSPFVLAARSSLGVKSLQELVDYAKAHPGKLNFGSAGIGSSPHLGFELLKYTTGINIVHVPYKSGSEAVNAAVGGQTDLAMDAIPVVMPHVKSGKLTALALAATQPSPAAQGVPTSAQAGDKELLISSWNAFFVPKGTPDDVVQTLRKALQKSLSDKDLQEALHAQGSEVYTGTLPEYQAFIEAETAKWKKIVKEADIHRD